MQLLLGLSFVRWSLRSLQSFKAMNRFGWNYNWLWIRMPHVSLLSDLYIFRLLGLFWSHHFSHGWGARIFNIIFRGMVRLHLADDAVLDRSADNMSLKALYQFCINFLLGLLIINKLFAFGQVLHKYIILLNLLMMLINNPANFRFSLLLPGNWPGHDSPVILHPVIKIDGFFQNCLIKIHMWKPVERSRAFFNMLFQLLPISCI